MILLPQPRKGAEEFQKELLNHPVLLEVPAIKNQKIFHVHPPYYTTLSHWNVRGIENLCKLLYPDVFSSIIEICVCIVGNKRPIEMPKGIHEIKKVP